MAIIASMVLPSTSAHAADRCSIESIAKAYKSGLRQAKRRKYDRALERWQPLARAGFGPAQRELAKLHAAGRGVAKSLSAALLWSEVAKRAGDDTAARLSLEYRQKLGKREVGEVTARAKKWHSAPVRCKREKLNFGGAAGDRLPQVFEYSARGRNKEALQESASRELVKVLDFARKNLPGAALYLLMVDGFEFYKGERYHRYLDWKRGEKKNILRFAATNFEDKTIEFVAKSIILTIKRRIYSDLPDSTLADPTLRVINGIKLVGANYPDVRNEQFFSFVGKAMKMAEAFPPKLRQYIEIIDEIHYNPPSKHFVQAGTLDNKGGYYNKSLSLDGHRMMFLRRQVLYSSPLFFLRTIVHKGTHAAQDALAWRYRHEIPPMQRQVKKLRATGKGRSPEAKKLDGEIEKQFDYINRWYKGIQSSRGRIQDIRFECAATMNEVRAVRALKGSPDMLGDSGYVKLCPDVQRALVTWQNEQFRNRNNR